MWKQLEATNLLTCVILVLGLITLHPDTTRALSDKRLCADENCKEIISMGNGLINYPAGEEGMVSFNKNSQMRIMSKSAGSDLELWGVEVNGRKGYVPKRFVRETKVFVKEEDLKYEVPVKNVNDVPTLTTSEKVLEQESTIEKTTTPLNLTPVDSLENGVKSSSEEKFTAESSPVATPVMSEIVDGTKIPIFSTEPNVVTKNLQDTAEPDVDKNTQENIKTSDANILKNSADLVKNANDGNEQVQENDINIEKSIEILRVENSIKDINEVVKREMGSDQKKEVSNAEEQKEDSKTEVSNNSDVIINLGKKRTAENNTQLDIEHVEKEVAATEKQNSENLQQVSKEIKENIFKDGVVNETVKNVEDLQKATEKINHNNSSKVKEDQKLSVNDESVGTNTTTLPISNADSVNQDFQANEKVEFDTLNKDSMLKAGPVEHVTSTNNVNNAENIINQQEVSATSDNAYEELRNSDNVSQNSESILNTTEINTENLQQASNKIEENEITNNINTDMNSYTIDNLNSHSANYQQNVAEVQKENIQNGFSYQNYEKDEQDNDNINSFSAEATDSSHYSTIKEPINTEFATSPISNEKETTAGEIPQQTPAQEEIMVENVNPTSDSSIVDTFLTTPITPQDDYVYQQQLSTTNLPPSPSLEENLNAFGDKTTASYDISPTVPSETVLSQQALTKEEEKPKVLPIPTILDNYEAKENKGLFATIMGTVNNMLSINKIKEQDELERILFSKTDNKYKTEQENEANVLQYCKKIGPNEDCPETEEVHESLTAHFHHEHPNSIEKTDLNFENFLEELATSILEISDLLAFLVIVAAACLFFIFGYYCFCNSSREGSLLSKLNQLESTLLATHKENAILKHNLMSTRQKLASIEDNSFGSNDMVVSLKKELEEELVEKARLQEQITVLQKELENAADAGIELNKIVTELLSNQTGDESIISSVEELQKQLNEQQNTIYEINASLAEKSRENSELQLLIAEQSAKFETELSNVQRDNDELEHEKGNLLTKLDEMKNDFDKDITSALEGKNLEIKRLQNEIIDLTHKLENEHRKWQTSVAKIEALEECLKNVRKDPHVNIAEVIDVANVKAQLIEIQSKYKSLKDRLEVELDSRKLAESQLEVVSAEVEKLKQDFNQSEKDKLEAQTRLEVLSNYFKDKENQLQKELNLKEAMWLKQQGETTTTVDRVTAMQEEIQSLKSLNDSLRAEIEAQVAAHKAQTGTLENRAHETWLAARQSDRRYEEARAEATVLRRKLTALAGGNVNEANKTIAGPAILGDELTQAPSPIHMESPGSPMLGRMPPPPFLPPPFMGPPPPFMGMPPPLPFVPPGEMRPAPLGRIMSPPPQRSGRFSPQHLDYEDYLDYEGNNTWHRHTYSPPPRTYRSLSPTDSRYNYGTERDLISTYDTETDFSPPPSPMESRRRGGNSSERIDSNIKISYGNTKKFNASNKGPLSSGSEKSFNSPSHNDKKARKGNTNHVAKV